MLSKCCKSIVLVQEAYEAVMHYVCSRCSRDCEILVVYDDIQ